MWIQEMGTVTSQIYKDVTWPLKMICLIDWFPKYEMQDQAKTLTCKSFWPSICQSLIAGLAFQRDILRNSPQREKALEPKAGVKDSGTTMAVCTGRYPYGSTWLNTF